MESDMDKILECMVKVNKRLAQLERENILNKAKIMELERSLSSLRNSYNAMIENYHLD